MEPGTPPGPGSEDPMDQTPDKPAPEGAPESPNKNQAKRKKVSSKSAASTASDAVSASGTPSEVGDSTEGAPSAATGASATAGAPSELPKPTSTDSSRPGTTVAQPAAAPTKPTAKSTKSTKPRRSTKPFGARLFPSAADNPEQRYYKILIWSLIGVFALAVLVGVTTLMVALQGPETLVIPDVRNLDFADAVEALQARELGVRVQQRHFSDPSLKGKVVDQAPEPGGLIRAGRNITLTVSRGAVVDQVDDFIGRDIDEVRQELVVLFATYRPLLQIEEQNISYIFDESEAGTILDQDPEPGTELTGLTSLQLLVSRGPEVVTFPAPDFTQVAYSRAIDLLAARNQPFVFRLGEPDTTVAAGLVTAQEPVPGSSIRQNTPIVLTVQPMRTVPRGQLFGIFERTLPLYEVPVDVSAELIAPDETRSTIFAMKHPGGTLSFPYLVPENSQIVITAFGAELLRFIVTQDSQ